MAQFTLYRSTDGSAPVLTGQVGSLVALLDACLVTGYGSKVAAGWSKPFTGTNKAAFRTGAGGGGSQHYVRIGHDALRPTTGGAVAGGAQGAYATGFETMTDVDTGTGAFSTAAQGAVVAGVAGLHIRISNTADATARAWIVAADARTFYLFILTGDTANNYFGCYFGDFYSLVIGDPYRSALIAGVTENSQGSKLCDFVSATPFAAIQGHYFARGHTGLGGSVNFSKHGDLVKLGTTSNPGLFGVVPFTNPSDGGLYLSPVWITDPITTPVNGLRGRLRGFWHFLHPVASVVDGDTFNGVGELAGKSFLIIKAAFGAAGAGSSVYVIETSNTLETN